MLFGQDFGRRHQGALPAGVDRHGRSQRGDHGLARADIALQQSMHRLRPRQIAGDFLTDTPLRVGQRERQHRQQLLMDAATRGVQRRRLQPRPLALRLQLAQLLSQQLVELQPLPGRMALIFQCSQASLRRRMVQKHQGFTQGRQLRWHHADGQQFFEGRALQRRSHRAAQIGLRQAGAGRVDRAQGAGQRGVLVDRLEGRVHHLAAEEAMAQFAAHAQPLTDRHASLLGGVEVDEAQQQLAAFVLELDQQLPAPAQVDMAFAHQALALHRLPFMGLGDRRDAGFVFVAQRQVQGEIDVAQQAKLFQRFLGR